MRDARQCTSLDHWYVKGWLRQAQALVGPFKKREAFDVLLDASKFCAIEARKILRTLTCPLNEELGYIDGLDARLYRGLEEPFCVTCGKFQEEMEGSTLAPCSKCKMVHFCCEGHRQDNEDHIMMCSTLLKIRATSEQQVNVFIQWPGKGDDDFLFEIIAWYS